MSDTQTPPVLYPYGQDWRGQLAMRRAEASRPLEERGIPDARWLGNNQPAPPPALNLDELAELVAEKLAAAVRPPEAAQAEPQPPAAQPWPRPAPSPGAAPSAN
jgi:hypothetical protein